VDLLKASAPPLAVSYSIIADSNNLGPSLALKHTYFRASSRGYGYTFFSDTKIRPHKGPISSKTSLSVI